jgi:hypothetical protein
MGKWRWIVGGGALLIAGAALFTLLSAGSGSPGGAATPALDDIDADSRKAMRELLRDAGREE